MSFHVAAMPRRDEQMRHCLCDQIDVSTIDELAKGEHSFVRGYANPTCPIHSVKAQPPLLWEGDQV